MKKIFLAILISIFILGFTRPVFAADTEVFFETQPLFSETNFTPGQTLTRWVKFKNNTTDPLKAAAKAINLIDDDGFGNWLDLVIKEGATELYHGTLTNFFNASEIILSAVAGNGSQAQYDFSITMKEVAGNDMQGQTLNFDIQVGIGSAEAIGGETNGQTNEPGNGAADSGGYNYQGLEIYNETVVGLTVTNTSAAITWLTNHPAASRVIYDTVSHPNLSSSLPPNYGYWYSTPEIDNPPMVTGHTVVINGLTPGTTYYFRPVSHGSPEKYGQELAFTTLANALAPDQTTLTNPTETKNESGAPAKTPGRNPSAATVNPGNPAGNNPASPSGAALGATEESSAQTKKINKIGNVLGAAAAVCPRPPWWVFAYVIIICLIILNRYYRYWQKKKFKRWYLFPIILNLITSAVIIALWQCWL